MRLSDIEYSRFSQNGEDGLIEFLTGCLSQCDRVVVEIGSGNGVQNNSRALFEDGWTGVAIDRKKSRVEHYRTLVPADQLDARALRVTPALAADLAADLPQADVFSLDIDFLDWHVANAMTKAGWRPKIVVCEYNPAFEREPLTVPLQARRVADLRLIYFGAGVEAWRRLWEPLGYRFVTCESSGINCLFVREADLSNAGRNMTGSIDGLIDWCDRATWAERWGPPSARREMMRMLPLERC